METGRLIRLAALLGGIAAGSAFASDVTFTATGTFQDGSSLGGTLVIDTGTGFVQSNGLDLTVTGGVSIVDYVFDTLTSTGAEATSGAVNVWFGIDATDSSVPGPNLQLDVLLGTATNLMNYAGGHLCYFVGPTENTAVGLQVGSNCGAFFSNWNLGAGEAPGDPPLTGTNSALTAAAAPEPAAVWLQAVPALWLILRQRKAAESR
jgi:hypothetical protein